MNKIAQKALDCIKRPQVWGFLVSVAIMAIISIMFFYPDNYDGNTLQQSDMTQGAANGHEAQEYEAQTGEKALWTNSLFGGMPTFQISPSYPSNSLFDWLNSVYGLGLPSPSNLLFMMMLGFMILLTCMRMRWYYALLGAIAWGFSSYYIIIIGAGHIWKFVALTYIPPTIGGLVLCYRGRYIVGAAMTALFAMLQLNANHPQMSYYFAFVMVGFAIAYLCDAIRDKKLKQWGIATATVVVAGALAVGANLPSLYHTYKYAAETKRSQSELTPLKAADETDDEAPKHAPTGGMPYGDIVGWSYGGSETFSLLIPNIKGGASAKPVNGQMVAASMADVDGADAYENSKDLLQYFPQYFNDSEGTNGPVYVGAIIFALFILGCIVVRGPMKWVLLVLTVLSVLLALGRNFDALTDFMIYNFPMYNKFRAVESILVIAEFTMPLLAIMGLHTIFTATPEEREKRFLMPTIVAFGAPALICLIAWFSPTTFGEVVVSPQDNNVLEQIDKAYGPQITSEVYNALTDLRIDMVASDASRSLLFLIFGFSLMMAGVKWRQKDTLVVGGLSVLTLFDLYGVDKRYINHESFTSTVNEDYYNPLAPDALDEAILADTTQDYRVLDIPGFGTARRSYHHKMVGGYHAAKLNRYEDLIQRKLYPVLAYGYAPEAVDLTDEEIQELTEAQRGLVAELLSSYRVLDMLNTRYIITGNSEEPLIENPYALGNAWLVNDIVYAKNADAEMAALDTIEPAIEAVADEKFRKVLGENTPALSDGDDIELVKYTPNELTYAFDSKVDAIAVFSEIYFPWGWQATIDGKPAEIGRVDYVLRAIRVPAGKHTIVMRFDPESMHTTATVAYSCVTVIYLLALMALFMAVTGFSLRRKPVYDDDIADTDNTTF